MKITVQTSFVNNSEGKSCPCSPLYPACTHSSQQVSHRSGRIRVRWAPPAGWCDGRTAVWVELGGKLQETVCVRPGKPPSRHSSSTETKQTHKLLQTIKLRCSFSMGKPQRWSVNFAALQAQNRDGNIYLTTFFVCVKALLSFKGFHSWPIATGDQQRFLHMKFPVWPETDWASVEAKRLRSIFARLISVGLWRQARRRGSQTLKEETKRKRHTRELLSQPVPYWGHTTFCLVLDFPEVLL